MKAEELYVKEFGNVDSIPKESVIRLLRHFSKVLEMERTKFKNNSGLANISVSLTPFGESIKLLRDLADLQNGAPLEQYRKEWEETMEQVYDFLNRWEGQCP